MSHGLDLVEQVGMCDTTSPQKGGERGRDNEMIVVRVVRWRDGGSAGVTVVDASGRPIRARNPAR